MAATFASEGTNVFRTDGRYELVAECRTAAYAQLVRDGLNMLSTECERWQRPGGAHGDVVDAEILRVMAIPTIGPGDTVHWVSGPVELT